METRPELGEKNKSAKTAASFASRKVLDKFSKTSLLNKPTPKLNFQKNAGVISISLSTCHILPVFWAFCCLVSPGSPQHLAIKLLFHRP